MNSIKRKARIAGLFYLLMAITGPLGILYAPSQIMVEGDVAATFQNLSDQEFLFRLGTFSFLLTSIVYIFLVLAFNDLFRPISEKLTNLMLVFVLVQVPIFFLLETFNLGALLISRGEILSSLAITEKQEFASLLLLLNSKGEILLSMFWGLWLFPLGLLSIKSGFIPKIIGVLLILGGVGYVIESTSNILFAEINFWLSTILLILVTPGELIMVLWLLIKGVREPKAA